MGDATVLDAASDALVVDASITDDAGDATVPDAAVEAGVDGGTAPPIGLYRGACDGSAGVWLDTTHFLSLDDETQTWRIFAAGVDGTALQSASFSAAIGVTDEADVEDAVRIGDRVYAITSHGRDKNGNLETDRYRFFAFDLEGDVPTATLTLAGTTSTLLADMLDPANYLADDEDARELLIARSALEDDEDPNLAPKVNGTSIEGLAVLPDGATLAIGFRNPKLNGKALVVTLTNAAAVIDDGATPIFGRIIRMDFGGLGVRAMTYDPDRDLVWIMAGPHDTSAGPFKLYSWSGVHTDAPVYVADITAPTNSAPEVILPISESPYLRIVYDQGSVKFSGTECKELTGSIQRFTDTTFLVP